MKQVFAKPILSEDNTLTYENVFNDGDKVIYTPVSTGVKEEIVLEEYAGNNIFEFVVELENLEPLCLKGDSIPLIDAGTKEQKASISQIDIKDSSPQFKVSIYNTIELEKVDDNVYTLKLIVDEAFLTDESTVYPVIIDPTITFNADPIYDAPVFSGYPNTNFNSNTYDVVGYHGTAYGEAISFVKLNNLQNYKYVNQANITSAYLHIYEGSGKTNSATVNVFNCMQTWNNTSVTYNTKPTIHTEPYSSRIVSSSGWYNFDITALLRGWMRYSVQDAGGKSQDYGIALKMASTGVSSKSFASANNTSYPPSIIINYYEDTSLDEGEYFIRSKYSLLLVDTELNESAMGNVIQYTHTGQANQTWKVKHLGNGLYQLQSKYYNYGKSMCVQSYNPGNGTNVSVCSTEAIELPVFRLIENVDGTYRILSACGTQNVGLDVCGPSLESKANIQTWNYEGVPQQRWKFYKAYSKGPLSYWNSDSDMISYMNIPHNRGVKIYVDKTQGFGKSIDAIKRYVGYGMSVWQFNYSFVEENEAYDVCVKGITRAEAQAWGCWDNDVSAFTTTPSPENEGKEYIKASFAGIVRVNGRWKTVYSLEKKTVYLIWDTTETDGIKTSNYSEAKWKVTTAHEIGHAMGYEGHSQEKGLMNIDIGNVMALQQYEPNSDEIKHLFQMYY